MFCRSHRISGLTYIWNRKRSNIIMWQTVSNYCYVGLLSLYVSVYGIYRSSSRCMCIYWYTRRDMSSLNLNFVLLWCILYEHYWYLYFVSRWGIYSFCGKLHKLHTCQYKTIGNYINLPVLVFGKGNDSASLMSARL